MKLTDYHAKYFAHELTKRFSSDNIGKLAGALVDAQVDLNPHQVEAALFAFQSPLARGALLADEVGLGKTIEAGLVISQKWAERKRRILIITPANLRKQWHQELQEKFFLPCRIFETRSYNAEIKNGNLKPFDGIDAITICSYQFTKSKATDVLNSNWDLVVIDEAHRLRNVYKPSNVIANTLKLALANVPNKLLLTATPLQNSLLELFGLVSFIDERDAIKNEILDLESFRELAVSITNNAKGRALIAALEQAFSEAERLGASRKAIIFTESRKTQLYLLRVLGAIESGVDFEKRIATIYHNCRTPDEIKTCFDQLQSELSAQISDAMTRTRKQLLENFDEEVHEKLRVNMASSKEYRSRYEQIRLKFSKYAGVLYEID